MAGVARHPLSDPLMSERSFGSQDAVGLVTDNPPESV